MEVAPSRAPLPTGQGAPSSREWLRESGRPRPAVSGPKPGGAEAEPKIAEGATAGPLGARAAPGAQAERGPRRHLYSEKTPRRRLPAARERHPGSRRKDSTPSSPLFSPRRLAGPSRSAGSPAPASGTRCRNLRHLRGVHTEWAGRERSGARRGGFVGPGERRPGDRRGAAGKAESAPSGRTAPRL